VAAITQWSADEDWQRIYGSSPSCLAVFNRLSCELGCSPYQSDFIITVGGSGNDGSGNQTAGNTTVPGDYGTSVLTLCNSFCNAWFDACSDVTIAGSTTVRNLYVVPQAFCEAQLLPFNTSVIVRNTALCFDGVEKATSAPETFLIGSGDPTPFIHTVGTRHSISFQAADIFGIYRTQPGMWLFANYARTRWSHIPFLQVIRGKLP
jgi:hypothetical protein